MKQLDQRVSKLELVMGNRPPRLEGKSTQELVELLEANLADPKRLDLIFAGVSEEQLDALIERANQRIAARRAEKPEAIK